MTVDERADLVLDFARILYINGQATEQTVDAPERLGRALGLTVTVMPRWGEMQVVAHGENGGRIAQARADPAGVEMDRVASAMRAIEDIA